MEVSAIHTQPLSQAAIERKEGLSLTDVKTHALVVLSYLLIGIGILIACSSPYIAFTISPMVAMAAPVVPIALGVKVKTMVQYPTEVGLQHLDDSHIPSIRGIHREGLNCWLNAALQVVFNIPVFRKRLERCSAYSWKLGTLASAFQQYEADQCHEGKRVSEVNSQKIRDWLSNGLGKNKQGIPIVNPDSDRGDCPMMFMDYYLSQMGHPVPIEKSYGVNQKETRLNRFDLTNQYVDTKNPSVQKAFEEYFPQVSSKDIPRKRLKFPPEDFFVEFPTGGTKYVKKIDVPLELSFTKQQFRGGR